MRVLTYLLINGIAVFLAAYILPGVSVDSFFTAIIVALVLGIVNALLKPLLVILTLPFTILTLGLFTFIINGLLVLVVDALIAGFTVSGLLWAVLFSLVITVVSSFLNNLTKEPISH